ncbi:MAG: phosphotransferase family protein [Gammaproteobacteria bacterium]|nr:phosphotransferase family protein [Gammaproteobacteria bacterium]
MIDLVDPFKAEALPELNTVRPGEDLDWDSVQRYLREQLTEELDLDGPFDVLQFPNGSANLTYMVRFGTTELVLRRPPFGTLAPGAHDMRREHRVLSRLWQIFDKAPRAYLFCDDHSVGGADFFVMERRAGEVIRAVIPESMRDHENVGHRVGLALVDAIAEFHRLDPADAELGDLGRPDGFVARQVAGWKKRWDLVADERHDDAMTDVYQRLQASQPDAQCIAFVHNDLKLDNCMFDPSDPDRVIAFFDWDMTTLGDPLIDLGTLLNYWPDPGDDDENRRHFHPGMESMGLPTRQQVVGRYGERTGFDISRVPWYEAFAQWKTATVVQQLHHRWKVGDSTDERMATVAETLPLLVGGADRLLAGIGS